MKVLFYEHIATSVYKEHDFKRRCKYSTIIKKLGLKGCFCIIDGDETLYYPDCKDLKPKNIVIHIKRVPQKSGGNLISAVVGTVLVAAGVVVGIATGWTGVGAAVGAGMITAGASLIVGAGISELMGVKAPNAPTLKDDAKEEKRYGLTGTSNKVSLGSKYPVIFGRHSITPPIVGNYYTELENNTGSGDQFMNVLLCVGYAPLSVKNIKIGANELAKNTNDVRNGTIQKTGTYDADIEIRQNGTYPNLYPYKRYEEQISAEIKHYANESQYTGTRLTIKGTNSIYIIVSFQGLYTVSSKGEYGDASVTIGMKYRKKNAVSWINGGTWTYKNNKRDVLRYAISKTFSAAERNSNPSGEWEIILYRTTAPATSSTVVDKCYWATLRCDTSERPVIQKELNKMCVLALRIRANDQAQGILDQINMTAQSVFPIWDGNDWNQMSPTSNPASCYLAVLRSKFLSRKVSDDRIDWDAIQNFYEWCATNGYECNGVISNGEQVFNILNKILQTSRANFYLKDGLYSLTHDIQVANPVALFTPKNSRNFSAQKLFPTHIDGIDATFDDASNEWKTDNQIVYPYGHTETGEETNQEMNMWGVTSFAQVVKLSRYILACNQLRPETYSLTVGLENFSIPLGSRCLIQTDVLSVGLAGGRIKAVDGQRITIDEIVQATDPNKTYALKVFHRDGTITNITVNTPTIPVNTLIATGEFTAEPGDIYAFGIYEEETLDCIVTGKTIGDNLSGTLTFMPYAPEVFNCDNQPIPEYNPHITIGNPQGYSIIGESLEPTKGVAFQDDGIVYYDFADYAMHADDGDYYYNRGDLLGLGKGYYSNITRSALNNKYYGVSDGTGQLYCNVDNSFYKSTTISFFMANLTLSSTKKTIWKYEDVVNKNSLEFYTENNVLCFECQGFVKEITGYDFTEEHHFAIIRDIEHYLFRIYIDGQLYAEQGYDSFTYNLISEDDDNLIDEDGNNLISEQYAFDIVSLDRTKQFHIFYGGTSGDGAAVSLARFRIYRRILSEKEVAIMANNGILSTTIEVLNRFLGSYVDSPADSKIGDTFKYTGDTNNEFINDTTYIRTLAGWIIYGG